MTSSRSPANVKLHSPGSPKDFGVSEACLHRWLKMAEVEDGPRPGITQAEAAEMRELRKRNKLLEQENEVLRRAAIYLGQGLNPKRSTRWSVTLPQTGFPSYERRCLVRFDEQRPGTLDRRRPIRNDVNNAYEQVRHPDGNCFLLPGTEVGPYSGVIEPPIPRHNAGGVRH